MSLQSSLGVYAERLMYHFGHFDDKGLSAQLNCRYDAGCLIPISPEQTLANIQKAPHITLTKLSKISPTSCALDMSLSLPSDGLGFIARAWALDSRSGDRLPG